MMTEKLKSVISQAEKLTPEEQDALAILWEEELEERDWDAITAKPHVRKALKQLAEEALAEHARGETEEWPCGLCA